ncbi:hypothetical protein ACQPXH_30120 [Nocardia sp. CA-135953]
MHTIDLAYVGRGLHEELVTYLAGPDSAYITGSSLNIDGGFSA